MTIFAYHGHFKFVPTNLKWKIYKYNMASSGKSTNTEQITQCQKARAEWVEDELNVLQIIKWKHIMSNIIKKRTDYYGK